jgi:hypothetical protein
MIGIFCNSEPVNDMLSDSTDQLEWVIDAEIVGDVFCFLAAINFADVVKSSF